MKRTLHRNAIIAGLIASAVIISIGYASFDAKASDDDSEEKPGPEQVFGRIQYVKAFGDVRVKIVDAFGDLRVQIVQSFADAPGEWEIVDNFPDFKVEIVDHQEDFTIEYVQAFPGVRE